MTASTPLLAVVIPAYNRERTLAATVDSVLAAGVPTEIVVVDDGSKDGTVAVAERYAPRVKLIRQANAGPATARNTGARATTAPLLAFLDSDDTWKPGVVADLLSALANNPDLEAVFAETLVGNDTDGYAPLSESTGRGTFGSLLTHPAGANLFVLDREAFLTRMLDRNQVFLGSAVFRRPLFEKVGGFDPDLFGGEDFGFCLRAAAIARFGFLSVPLAVYEKHPGGLSADPDRMAREFAKAMRSFLAFEPKLSPAMAALARQRAAELAFGYAYRAYDAGYYAEARRRFRVAAGLAPGRAKAAALWAVCCLPGGLVRGLRGFKHQRGG